MLEPRFTRAAFDKVTRRVTDGLFLHSQFYAAWAEAFSSGDPRAASRLDSLLVRPMSWTDLHLVDRRCWLNPHAAPFEMFIQTLAHQAFAGRHLESRLQTAAAFPFWRYTAVEDHHTCPEHAARHGLVLPAEDSWWNEFELEMAWGCRCTVTAADQRTLDRRGWRVGARPAG